MQDTETMTDEFDDYPEYDDYPSGGRVLWGRFAFWGFMLLFFFILGRISAPSAESQLAERDLEIVELNRQITTLQNDLEALTAGGSTAPEGAEGETDDPEGEGDDSAGDNTAGAPEGSQTYTVVGGDTLNGISQKMYGTTEHAALIVEANGLDRSAPLRVGQELVIPPAPSG